MTQSSGWWEVAVSKLQWVCVWCSQAGLHQLTASQQPSLPTVSMTTAKVLFSTCVTKWSSELSCGTSSTEWPLHARCAPVTLSVYPRSSSLAVMLRIAFHLSVYLSVCCKLQSIFPSFTAASLWLIMYRSHWYTAAYNQSRKSVVMWLLPTCHHLLHCSMHELNL